jgi:cation transport protein ChaC
MTNARSTLAAATLVITRETLRNGSVLASVRARARPRGRGSPEHPGLMLALHRGGGCRGTAFRIAATEVRSELLLVWRREMFSGAHLPRWVTVQDPDGPIRAVTFVVNQADPHYVACLSLSATVEHITSAAGDLGTCLDYFERTVAALNDVGFRDAALKRIATAIQARPMAA